jgi:hypothetical protein
MDKVRELVTNNIDRFKFTMGVAGRDAIARELCRLCGLSVREFKDHVLTPDELTVLSRGIAATLRQIAIDRQTPK